MVRPSIRSTDSVSTVTATPRTRMSFASAEMLMPCPQQGFPMIFDHGDDLGQCPSVKSDIARQRHIFQPYLGRRACLVDMDMGRLVRLVAVEIEAEALKSQHGRHYLPLSLQGRTPGPTIG
eukprot:TRINITY_DN58630_c0_g1_i1.p1 TRINITY_DN58630_c0_g1~~TRINITY_DN58630_c0_g1_i1.p1  ORF type:complete len:121 (+),score=0.27 TRINITY_DN58630_c0_g1_i1:129-491(+)